MSTGYENDKEDEKFVGEQQWVLKEWQSPVTGRYKMGLVEVFEDGVRSVRGHLSFENIEEFNWLKARIDGGRRVE